ncbi:MAG: 50S ribosomal protein L16 [Candidatus Saganbacteria bacterium]|nr:50S ribosomal protein L16 [Candidatus Saganbacteria bacterium]
MVLQPGRTKFRKQQRGVMKGTASSGNTLAFGSYGLQAMEKAWLKVKQLESARKALTHFIKRGGKVWIRVLADKPYSSRPAETRMGGGKGAPEYFVACVRPGTILFELAGVKRADGIEAMRLAAHKMPIKTRFVEKV